jgi:regulator of protease activity HflC (stomatin/prohibitin superfamily)
MGIIVILIAFIALGFRKKPDGGRNELHWRVNGRQWISALGLIIIAFSFFTTIPANSIGILYSPLNGGVQDRTLGEGVQVKSPIDEVYIISTEVQSKHIENLMGQTMDSQFLTIAVDVKYYVDKARAFDVFKRFKTLSNVDNSLILPATQRAIEQATTSYNIIEVLGDKRGEVYNLIEAALAERFAQDGITLHSITFLDTDGGDEIEQAIRAEAVAKKAVETAEQERLEAEIDAETRIIQANAEAEEKRILASAIAENPEVLELEWIKKWNGQLPAYISGESDGVMIDLSNLNVTGSGSTPSTTTQP